MENQNEDVLLAALLELEKTNENNLASGACIYTPPSGRPQCFQMTPEQCSAIKGVYLGGKCPNTFDELDISNLQQFENISKGNTVSIQHLTATATEQVEAKGNPYLIVFINKSNRCFTSYRFRFINSPNWTSWTSINICRTCNLGSMQDCFNSRQWKDLFVIDCSAGAFELEIRTDKNPQGEYFLIQSDTYVPDCTKAGGVVSWEE
ncbi:hypothetical protein BN1195_02992 [Chryseobacterium oranimense G311]|uniref:hypothetical protein n=1 Tax=Chryseobacterium oranimense TaxID=421058 RepID=UPI0005337D05|nr:hypothetical protein [Chryseobacterium oranimense]CEJ70664.1 hypothetical protein BN1195_02992 [Chryseobacterium oranimense G311]